MGLTLANANTLFPYVLSKVDDTLNHASRARTMFNKSTENWTGDYVTWALHVTRNGGMGAGVDGGAFPTSGNQGHQQARAGRKMLMGTMQLTDAVMYTAPNEGPTVAVGAVKSETKGFMRDFMKFENFFMFGDGTGLVCTINETGSSAVQVTDGRALWEGVQYDEYNGSTFQQTVTCDQVDNVLDSGATAADFSASVTSGNKLYWKGSYGIMPQGLAGLVDDTAATFQNIAVGTYLRYTSQVSGNSGTNRDLTPTIFRQHMAAMMAKSGSDRPMNGIKVLGSQWQLINVEELYEGSLRLTPESSVGGAPVASFQSALGQVDLTVDTDATYNTLYFVDPSNITRCVQRPLDWRKGSGGQILTPSQTSAIWRATAIEIMEFIIRERHTSGKVTDLAEARISSI